MSASIRQHSATFADTAVADLFRHHKSTPVERLRLSRPTEHLRIKVAGAKQDPHQCRVVRATILFLANHGFAIRRLRFSILATLHLDRAEAVQARDRRVARPDSPFFSATPRHQRITCSASASLFCER